MELKDKVSGFTANLASIQPETAQPFAQDNIQKAVEALSVLGYGSADVMPVLSGLDFTLSVEQMIAAVLKEMGKG